MESPKKMTKRKFRAIPQVERFYKLAYKYNLRENVYESALKICLRLKEEKKR